VLNNIETKEMSQEEAKEKRFKDCDAENNRSSNEFKEILKDFNALLKKR
jgi:hypothetical protein